jgi:ABC-type nitrate/sulfonate/bicarbonate transport system substrate-binding protein
MIFVGVDWAEAHHDLAVKGLVALVPAGRLAETHPERKAMITLKGR